MAHTTDRSAFPPLTPPAAASPASSIPISTIECAAGHAAVRATLAVPAEAVAVAIVLHDAANGRLDPAHAMLIDMLHDAGMATMRADLCTADEAHGDHAIGAPFFDVSLLVDRLLEVVAALRTRPETQHLRVGVVGDRAVAAAALYAAAEHPEQVSAVVTRSARPDLAGPFFPRLAAPTLLIVGAHDAETRRINEQAFRHLEGPRSIEVVPGAGHQFEEPGAREQAAVLTRDWLARYLCPPSTVSAG